MHLRSILLNLKQLPRNCYSTSAAIVKKISSEDIRLYAQLTGDDNPVHFQGDQSLVHGTYLLGLVSSVMGTKCPGPGSKVIELKSKFVNPCLVGSEVQVSVQVQDLRKITTATFQVKTNEEKSRILVEGTARIYI